MAARFLHAKDFAGEFNRQWYSTHCDGFTREPHSDRNNLRYPAKACHCAGLGLDPRTGKYKVVQAFYRCISAGFLSDVYLMGLEVFTIGGGGGWRETMIRPGHDLGASELTTVCDLDRIRYQGRQAREWKNLWTFNVCPFTENLVRLTPAAGEPSESQRAALLLHREELLSILANSWLQEDLWDLNVRMNNF